MPLTNPAYAYGGSVGPVSERGSIPSASILTLFTTPFQLLPAPGAGAIILVDEIIFRLVFNSIAYAGANALEMRYTNASGVKVTASDLANTFLNSASGTNYQTIDGVTTAFAPVANAAVVACVPTANPTAGNSVLDYLIRYHVVAF